MQRHLAEPMSVQSLASLVNLSPSRFRALFTAQTGLGPAQYLQWLRYRRARLQEQKALPRNRTQRNDACSSRRLK